MNKRRDTRHKQIDSVTDKKDYRGAKNLEQCSDGKALKACIEAGDSEGEVIKHLCQHTAREADCEESDIREHIREQTGYIILGIPKA